MKLLKKNDIDKAKALDRQREIEQGKQLATRVDNLRELLAEEDKNLASFREKTLKTIMGEITPLLTQKEELLTEIINLQSTKKTLQIPLDREWAEVNRKKVFLSDWEIRLASLDSTLRFMSDEITAKQRELHLQREKLLNDVDHSNELATRSGRIYEEANKVLAEARNKAQSILFKAELTTLELIKREEKVAARERDVDIQLNYIAKSDFANTQERMRLFDERKTLERELNRLK